MQDLLRTTDPVLFSYVAACLEEADIGYAILDRQISNVEGSVAIFPQRVVVIDEDVEAARSACIAAGIDRALLVEPSGSHQLTQSAGFGWRAALRGLLTAR